MRFSPEISLGVLATWTLLILGFVWRMSAMVANLQRIGDNLHELTEQVTEHMGETRKALHGLEMRVTLLEGERRWGPH
jgi:hypothetical protein